MKPISKDHLATPDNFYLLYLAIEPVGYQNKKLCIVFRPVKHRTMLHTVSNICHVDVYFNAIVGKDGVEERVNGYCRRDSIHLSIEGRLNVEFFELTDVETASILITEGI
jgi:hypothetical protein